MDVYIEYSNTNLSNYFSWIGRGKYMKRSSIDWYKASTWLIILTGCFGFYGLLYYMGWLEEFFGFILLGVTGYFAYMSSVLVDEQKKAGRKND